MTAWPRWFGVAGAAALLSVTVAGSVSAQVHELASEATPSAPAGDSTACALESAGPAAPPPAAFTPVWPCRIDSVEISGLWRTADFIVLGELPWTEGQVVTLAQWELASARLWNTGLFSKVQATLVRRAGKTVALVALEERWTINLLFSFAVVAQRSQASPALRGASGPAANGSSTWWSVGLSDLNLGGRFIEAAATYEQFNAFTGGLAFIRAHRFLGRRMDATLLWEYLARPRVGFADRRQRLRGELNQLAMDDHLRFGGRLDLQRDGIFDAGDTVPNLPASSATALLDVGVRYGRVDIVRVRQQGASLEVRAAVGRSEVAGQHLSHGQGWLQALAYVLVGVRGNVAGRLQAGMQSAAPPQLQFFIGGLNEVRGVRDSYLRADRFVLANLEVRTVLYDAMWLAVVPAVFIDAAVANDAQRGATLLASTGGGVRLLVPRFVRTGLRVDVAVPVAGLPCTRPVVAGLCPAFNVGIFQYF
ncbi:MAG: hypothetical protein EXR77_08315 [Myxococcales bacterium]|nr:hypothetical protein [Myxococcales bacterium]